MARSCPKKCIFFKDKGPNVPSRKMSLLGELSKVSVFVFAGKCAAITRENKCQKTLFQHGTSVLHGHILGCFSMERVFCMVIFWVCYTCPEFSTIEKHQFRFSATGLPQVVAEALKTTTTEELVLNNNDIGEQGAEAPLLPLKEYG